MSKGQPRDPRKARYWRRHLQRWQRSGRSIRDYCAQHRLAEPSFYAWRRTLNQRDTAAAPAVEPPLTFLPVHVQTDPLPPSALELVLTNGRVLRIPPGGDPAQVRDLVAVLEDPPC